MYQKVDTNLNFVDREKQVEKFWKENHIFEKSMEDRKDDPTYMFYDGPPTVNGKPHIGHVLTRVIKDMIPRYRTMKGYMVPRKAGWDTHGLPVELEVEKKLGLDGKEHRPARRKPRARAPVPGAQPGRARRNFGSSIKKRTVSKAETVRTFFIAFAAAHMRPAASAPPRRA